MKLTDQVSKHKINEYEIEGQDIYRLKIDYITMQCSIFLKQLQNTSQNCKVSCIICIGLCIGLIC